VEEGHQAFSEFSFIGVPFCGAFLGLGQGQDFSALSQALSWVRERR
jgi:hypothetical protein